MRVLLECELFSDKRRERGGEDRKRTGRQGVGMSTGVGQRAGWGRVGGGRVKSEEGRRGGEEGRRGGEEGGNTSGGYGAGKIGRKTGRMTGKPGEGNGSGTGRNGKGKPVVVMGRGKGGSGQNGGDAREERAAVREGC